MQAVTSGGEVGRLSDVDLLLEVAYGLIPTKLSVSELDLVSLPNTVGAEASINADVFPCLDCPPANPLCTGKLIRPAERQFHLLLCHPQREKMKFRRGEFFRRRHEVLIPKVEGATTQKTQR